MFREVIARNPPGRLRKRGRDVGVKAIPLSITEFFMDTKNDVNVIPILERNAPGTSWRYDGLTGNDYDKKRNPVYSTSAQAMELPGEFMLGLYASGIRIAKIRVKRSGLIARLTLELIMP